MADGHYLEFKNRNTKVKFAGQFTTTEW